MIVKILAMVFVIVGGIAGLYVHDVQRRRKHVRCARQMIEEEGVAETEAMRRTAVAFFDAPLYKRFWKPYPAIPARSGSVGKDSDDVIRVVFIVVTVLGIGFFVGLGRSTIVWVNAERYIEKVDRDVMMLKELGLGYKAYVMRRGTEPRDMRQVFSDLWKDKIQESYGVAGIRSFQMNDGSGRVQIRYHAPPAGWLVPGDVEELCCKKVAETAVDWFSEHGSIYVDGGDRVERGGAGEACDGAGQFQVVIDIGG